MDMRCYLYWHDLIETLMTRIRRIGTDFNDLCCSVPEQQNHFAIFHFSFFTFHSRFTTIPLKKMGTDICITHTT